MRTKLVSTALAVMWGLMSSRAAVALPAQEPLFLVSQISPMVMFAMSVDHQLFKKAFADYSDLNGDGKIDNTYTDTFDYYGYFDSNRCYQYDNGSGNFEPRDAANGANSHHCNNAAASGDWSGNFLNWATMMRIDVLRKALYGGKRFTDTDAATVLERELVPDEVHAFVKVFTADAGDDMDNYVPSNYNAATSTISICNVTPGPGGNTQTQSVNTATYPPKIRIASGSWPRWSADEVYQCGWRNNGTSPGTATNLYSPNTSNAPNVRVEVCVAGKLEENCKLYGATYKPVGLLQDYGEDGSLRFGLMTGSYQKRDKGGVLRKAMGYFAGNANAADDEVDLSDGTFNNVNGIVSTLDKLRINAWDYTSHVYQDCNTFGISINTYLTSNLATRKCSNWGNPLSELYLESVRYLIGSGAATNTFDVANDSLGLTHAAWDDPMPADDWCTPMNVVVLSSGDNSFDTDNLSGNVPAVLGDIDDATDAIGVEEMNQGVWGDDVFIGEVGAAPVANPDSNVCTAKTFDQLSHMRGLCPATPTKQGGYAMAGIAYKAHTTDLRAGNGYPDDQTIKTFAIAMAKNLPEFSLKVGGGAVTIVPTAYAGPTNALPALDSDQWKASTLAALTVTAAEYDGDGNLVYVRMLPQWEDSAWGNDYDLDVTSQISACVGAVCQGHDDDNNGANDSNPGDNTVRVTVRIVHKYAGVSVKVGFVASGSTADGEYTNLRYKNGDNFSADDFDNDNQNREPNPYIVTFNAGASGAVNLPTPLQLAAKYGSFNDSDNADPGDPVLPDVAAEWDEDGDGLSDSFFFADDPSQIGPKLAAYLSTIATTSSSASVVANSVSLQTNTRLFQARFDSNDWSGSVVSLEVDPTTGAVNQVDPEWDVAEQVKDQDPDTGREWITWDSTIVDGGGNVVGGGVPFRWGSLNVAQQTALNLNPASGNPDALGSARLDWLRGDQTNEVSQAGGLHVFRDRTTQEGEIRLLGDVVNSTPTVVGAPQFSYPDTMEAVAYSDFKAANSDVECFDSGGALRSVADLDREPILYFGGNDGALHGVSACTGDERIAYVPLGTYATLNELTSPNYQHKYYADGPITTVDAFFDGAWHTVLIGTMGGGGSGIFALDITDPGDFDESTAADVALWDIMATPTVNGSDFEQLGYAYSQPIIVKAEGYADWVAIFGNGYHGKDGKAVLYVVRLKDGHLLSTIDLSAAGPGSASHGNGNGLASVAAVDVDGDGDADLLYAGDLNGNLWRFQATAGSGFARANTTLLYKAKNPAGDVQHITSRVAVGFHPVYAKGRMVFFGTGKYYELTDQDPDTAVDPNTMYGIWDRDDGQTITSVTARNSNRLQRQTITTQVLETFGGEQEEIRIVSNTPIQWANPDSSIAAGACDTDQSCGWYLDMEDDGEKIVFEPILRASRLIFVTTTPSPVACDEGGSGWLMEIDPSNGGRLDIPVLDLDGDGVFDMYTVDDGNGNEVSTPISGVKSKVGIIQPPAILAGFGEGDNEFQTKNMSGSKNAQIDVKRERPDVGGSGRKSWVRIK